MRNDPRMMGGRVPINKIIPFSSVDGPGTRTAVFVQGRRPMLAPSIGWRGRRLDGTARCRDGCHHSVRGRRRVHE